MPTWDKHVGKVEVGVVEGAEEPDQCTEANDVRHDRRRAVALTNHSLLKCGRMCCKEFSKISEAQVTRVFLQVGQLGPHSFRFGLQVSLG